MFAVNDILKDLIGKKPSAKKPKKHKFENNDELTAKVQIENYPISLSQIIRNILFVYGDENKLTYYDIAQVLYAKGLLTENTESTPKLIASENAKQYGITLKRIHSNKGDGWQTVFDENGQKYVLSLLKGLNGGE